MFGVGQVLGVLRASALGLLAICMLLGPLAAGTSMAAPPVEACGESCPCEAASEAEEDLDHSRAESSHEEGSCPDDCRDCSCGSRVVLGLVTVAVPCVSATGSSSELTTLSDSPGLADVSGVFRPPRSAA